MPVYDYLCKQCKKEFEKVLTLKQHDEPITCPNCGGADVEHPVVPFYAVTPSKS